MSGGRAAAITVPLLPLFSLLLLLFFCLLLLLLLLLLLRLLLLTQFRGEPVRLQEVKIHFFYQLHARLEVYGVLSRVSFALLNVMDWAKA